MPYRKLCWQNFSMINYFSSKVLKFTSPNYTHSTYTMETLSMLHVFFVQQILEKYEMKICWHIVCLLRNTGVIFLQLPQNVDKNWNFCFPKTKECHLCFWTRKHFCCFIACENKHRKWGNLFYCGEWTWKLCETRMSCVFCILHVRQNEN